MLISAANRLALTIMGHLHERSMLLVEQRLLSLMIEKAARPNRDGSKATDLTDIIGLHESNQRRLAEIEGRRINKLVFPVRAAVLRMPRPIQALFRNALGRLLNPGQNRATNQPLTNSRQLEPSTPVPFNQGLPPPSLVHSVGVVMHIFYPELAAEMRAYLENIPGPTDLYISTDTLEKQTQLESIFAGWSAGRIEIRLAPNRGRDIAPKLVTFRDVYDRHFIVLHLHSKRSPHDSYLRMWRYFLFENLVGERDIAASILATLENVPSLGMVASDHYFAVSNSIAWGANLDIAQSLARRMGEPIDPATALDFPSGSMFWAKSAALKPLLDLQLSAEDFPSEEGQADATLAHAIERLYFLACKIAGFQWKRVCRSELIENGAQMRLSPDRPPKTRSRS